MSSLFYTRGWEIPEKRLFSKIKVIDHIFYVFTDAIDPFGLFESQFRFENRSPELKNKKNFVRRFLHSILHTLKEREEMIGEQISSFPCLRKHRRTSNENMYVDSRTNGTKWLGLPFDRNETSDVLWTRSHGQRTGVEKSWNTH